MTITTSNSNNHYHLNQTSNIQIFCPIHYYLKLKDESINLIDQNQNKIKLLGNALNKIHSNLCDRHSIFIETHQSICSICSSFINKYDNLIAQQLEEQQIELKQLNQSQHLEIKIDIDNNQNKNLLIKQNNELNDKIDENLDKFNLELEKLDRIGNRLDNRLESKIVLEKLDNRANNRIDKNLDQLCYYCNEIKLNNLNSKNIRNFYIQQNCNQNNVQINQQQQKSNRNSIKNNQHQRHFSDSFIRLKQKSNGSDEQFV